MLSTNSVIFILLRMAQQVYIFNQGGGGGKGEDTSLLAEVYPWNVSTKGVMTFVLLMKKGEYVIESFVKRSIEFRKVRT